MHGKGTNDADDTYGSREGRKGDNYTRCAGYVDSASGRGKKASHSMGLGQTGIGPNFGSLFGPALVGLTAYCCRPHLWAKNELELGLRPKKE